MGLCVCVCVCARLCICMSVCMYIRVYACVFTFHLTLGNDMHQTILPRHTGK